MKVPIQDHTYEKLPSWSTEIRRDKEQTTNENSVKYDNQLTTKQLQQLNRYRSVSRKTNGVLSLR